MYYKAINNFLDENMNIKKLIALDNPFRLLYHKIKAIVANFVYGFPSKDMTIIWVTGTNGKTTTCNIIWKWLKASGKKVFMFTTVNVIIDDEEFTNNTKMTSPDPFELQRLLKIAKQKGCEIAIIETASHGIKMHRVWGIEYDIAVLTNITQDHLDLHKTMDDYVHTKLLLFSNLIRNKRKPGIKKTWIINTQSQYKELFLDETYDSLFAYWNGDKSNLRASNIQQNINGMTFDVNAPWVNIAVNTPLIWEFNVQNILAAIWVFISVGLGQEEIKKSLQSVSGVPGRMQMVENNEWFKIIVDYAHTQDALENVLTTIKSLEWVNRIITVFWATGDRDKSKRPMMWETVSKYSDVVILTQDDDYTEDTQEIIKDVLPGIGRKQSEDFWVISDRFEAIRTALLSAQKDDVILVAGKWDEHVMITNSWPKTWHDKTVIEQILGDLDNHKIIE